MATGEHYLGFGIVGWRNGEEVHRDSTRISALYVVDELDLDKVEKVDEALTTSNKAAWNLGKVSAVSNLADRDIDKDSDADALGGYFDKDNPVSENLNLNPAHANTNLDVNFDEYIDPKPFGNSEQHGNIDNNSEQHRDTNDTSEQHREPFKQSLRHFNQLYRHSLAGNPKFPQSRTATQYLKASASELAWYLR